MKMKNSRSPLANKNTSNKGSSSMKQTLISRTAVITAVAVIGSLMFAISDASAALILIPYVQDPTKPVGEQWVHLAGGESTSWTIANTYVWAMDFRTSAGGGTRYLRATLDMRDVSWANPRVHVNIGTTPGDVYNPSSGTALFQASGTGGGWDGTLAGVTAAQFAYGPTSSYPKNPINGWTDNDGSGMLGEIVNWVMLKPDGSADAPTIVTNPAIALGFIWEDIDNSGKVSMGDQVILKYAITADLFAEMNTVEKLEMFIIPEPATGMFLIGGLAALLAGRRRRR